MAKTITVRATITNSGRGKLVLRLFLPQYRKNELLLQKGKQPEGIFNIVVL